MSKLLPSLRDLRYLIGLYETKSFSKAAHLCHVGQSTLSTSIRKLEQQLHMNLVERDTHTIRFTEQGERLVLSSKDLLKKAETMLDDLKSHQDPFTGKLMLGCIPTLAPFVLPKVIRYFRKQHTQMPLYLTENYTHELLQDLQAGQLDVLILALPFETAEFPCRMLFQDDFYLIKHRDRVVSKTMLKDFNRLPDQSVLLMDDAHCLRAQALQACQLENSRAVMPFKASSLSTLVQMIDQDLGVSFLPEMAINHGLIKHTQIEAVSLSGSAYRQVGLVWRKHFNRTPVCDELAQVLVNLVAK